MFWLRQQCNPTKQYHHKAKQYTIFFYCSSLTYPSHSFFEIASSRFFSYTCNCCNYAMIFSSIFPVVMAAYDMRFSMATKPLSLPPQCPCFFTPYKLTLQSFLQCLNILHPCYKLLIGGLSAGVCSYAAS